MENYCYLPQGRIPRIEASVYTCDEAGLPLEMLTIRPAEDVGAMPWEFAWDNLSLAAQNFAHNQGRSLPDWRFRIITEMETDGMVALTFGTLDQAVAKANKILNIPDFSENQQHSLSLYE